MTSKSLKDAVLDVAVKHFTFPPKEFSAYDITKILRKEVNDNLYSIRDFRYLPTKHAQEVPHSVVREVVAEYFHSKHFDRIDNGTFYVYTIGNIRNANDITTDSRYTRLIEILSNQTGISPNDITPNSTLSRTLNLDDLDRVEITMAIEEEFRKELNAKELDDSIERISDVRELFKFLVTEIAKNHAPNANIPNVAPSIVIKPIAVKDTLRMYLKARHGKGVTPSLKNTQKALKSGSSVREISDLAKNLGYKVIGNQQIPFNQWVIAQ